MYITFFINFLHLGELFELREELNSLKEDKKKEAVKKVIAAMTVGKDVSSLFTEVLNCIQTNNLELKKLVYLYVMNYAKTQPDRAILAVNTFQKVSHLNNFFFLKYILILLMNRTLQIQILLLELLPFVLWDVFELIKLLNICVNL